MHSNNIEIELNTDQEIGDNVMLKGTIMHEGINAAKVVTWLKPSKFDSALYYFYLKEDKPKGEQGREFTPKPISVKSGQYGLYCDGPIVEIEGLKFPVKGNVDFDNNRKSITLVLATENSIKYYTEKKGFEYVMETGDEAPSITIEEDTEVPF